MLQVASFKMSDEGKINELLKKHRIASGAHILVSNGEVVIPYEDGEPLTNEQRIASLVELRNNKRLELDIMEQSQRVIATEVKGYKMQLSEIEANLAEAKNEPNKKGKTERQKDLERQKAHAENVINQKEAQFNQNIIEEHNLKTNMQVFTEMIRDLKKA